MSGFCPCRSSRRAPNSRSFPNNTTRVGKLWHVASLLFAANPVRSHREWAGVIDRVNLPEPEVPQTASPGVGAIIRCLHRDFNPSNGHGRYALSDTCNLLHVIGLAPCMGKCLCCHSVQQFALWHIFCNTGSPLWSDLIKINICSTVYRFVRLVSLEEAYATNKKRRRLAYALRRKQTGSGYKGLWDRVGNDLFIIGEVAFDRCTPRKLHGHAPWWTLIIIAVSCLQLGVTAKATLHMSNNVATRHEQHLTPHHQLLTPCYSDEGV